MMTFFLCVAVMNACDVFRSAGCCLAQRQRVTETDMTDRQRERVSERQTDGVTQSEGEQRAHFEFQCVGNNKGTSAALVEL